MTNIYRGSARKIDSGKYDIGKSRSQHVKRAQVQARIPLKSQKDAAAKFDSWKWGELPEDAFRVIVWGKGPVKRSDPRVARLTLGRMGKVRQYHDPAITMCDFDQQRAPSMKRIFRLVRILSVSVEWVQMLRSSSGRWHMIVKWRKRWTRLESIVIQALLGSDYVREAHGLYRYLSHTKSKRWNFLFSEKLK